MSTLTWPRRALMALVHGYRLLLKPWLGNACRFEPTCSQYALDALQSHGALKGSLLTGARLLRCHPWCAGGVDPVPDDLSRPFAGLFTRFGSTAPEDSPSPSKNLP
jgi:putative membrane protein insertion efficiency factor